MNVPYNHVGRAFGRDAWGDSLGRQPVGQEEIRNRIASRLLAKAAHINREVVNAAMQAPDGVGVIAFNAQTGAMEGLAAAKDFRPVLTAEAAAPAGSELAIADRHPIDAATLQLQNQVGPSAEML